jgi:hypothetical protein
MTNNLILSREILIMHYFFKPHKENFKEWVRTGFIGILALIIYSKSIQNDYE